MHLRPQRRLQFLIFLFAASSLAVDRRAVKNDFSDYPSGAQQCLYDASDKSGCDGDTVPEMNRCLCGNGGEFVTNSAQCVAEKDPADMESTYNVMSSHCSDSSTPLSVSEHEWMAEESRVASSTSSTETASKTSSETVSISTAATTSAGPTPAVAITGSPSSTSTPDAGNSSGLSTGATVGLIVGSATAGVAFFAAALVLLCRYRRRRNHAYEEVHPTAEQLPSNPGGEGAIVFGFAGSEAAHPSRTSIAPSDHEDTSDPRRSWHLSPDGRQVPWSPGAYEVVKLHPGFGNLRQTPPDVYEMSTDSERPVSMSPSVAPAEMPIISITSPTVSPASRYSGVDWSPQIPEEPSRYEPYRPSR